MRTQVIAVNIKVMVYWEETQRSKAEIGTFRKNQLSRFFHPEDKGRIFLQNVGNYLPNYMAPHLTIP
jgi:hypothetical protein